MGRNRRVRASQVKAQANGTNQTARRNQAWIYDAAYGAGARFDRCADAAATSDYGARACGDLTRRRGSQHADRSDLVIEQSGERRISEADPRSRDHHDDSSVA